MAIAFDAKSAVWRVSAGTENFTHTPVGTPRGILVLVNSDVATDSITTVTYGGVSMVQAPLSPHLKTTGEVASQHAFFLGSGIPSGPQTVSVTSTSGGFQVCCVSMTAGRDTEIDDTSVMQSGSVTTPNVDLNVTAPSFRVVRPPQPMHDP